jgi:hypothetical protein
VCGDKFYHAQVLPVLAVVVLGEQVLLPTIAGVTLPVLVIRFTKLAVVLLLIVVVTTGRRTTTGSDYHY